LTTYYLMRYYLSKLTLPQIPADDSFLKSKTKQRLILTNNGIIHLIGDKMYDCKLKDDAYTEPIQNYIDKHDLCIGLSFQLQKSQNTQIPLSCKEIILNKEKYMLHEKSKTWFIIEKFDDKVSDFYFESTYEYDNKFLKKDILSFLSNFK